MELFEIQFLVSRAVVVAADSKEHVDALAKELVATEDGGWVHNLGDFLEVCGDIAPDARPSGNINEDNWKDYAHVRLDADGTLYHGDGSIRIRKDAPSPVADKLAEALRAYQYANPIHHDREAALYELAEPALAAYDNSKEAKS
jgi:hypothetical protein